MEIPLLTKLFVIVAYHHCIMVVFKILQTVFEIVAKLFYYHNKAHEKKPLCHGVIMRIIHGAIKSNKKRIWKPLCMCGDK